MELRLKKLSRLNLFGALLVAPLVLLPIGANAATADLNDPISVTNDYAITDRGSDGITDVNIDFAGTTGIWVKLIASPSTADERIRFVLKNSTGAKINTAWFEIAKPNGEDLVNQFRVTDWVFAISDDTLNINPTSGEIISETNSSQRIRLDFDPGLNEGDTMFVDLPNWQDFNAPKVDWWLNIDWNEEDNNRPSVGNPSVPAPKVLANGVEGPGPVTMQSGENLSIAITFEAGDSAGTDADWWAVAFTSDFGWFQYQFPQGWEPLGTDLDLNNVNPAFQGPLTDVVSPLELTSTPDLPKGSYEVFFGVDEDMNGVIDTEGLTVDSVKVNIE